MRLTPLLVLLSTLLCFVLAAPPAHAAGALRVMTPEIPEVSGEWHVRVRIDLPRQPDTLHLSMRFKFAKTMVYERAIMEKGKDPVLNKMSLGTPTIQIVPMMVDFGDAMGRVHTATIFEFELKRSSGFFEAGEYQLTVIGPDGEIGTGQKIILKGDNPPVYRGAITFDGPGSKIQHVSSGLDGGTKPKDDTPAAAPVSTDVAAVGSGSSMIPSDAYTKTPEEEIRDRPKGCGCAVPGGAETGLAGIGAAGLALAFAAARRRRRS